MSKKDSTVQVVETIKMLPLSDTRKWYDDFVGFSKEILKSGLDYGIIPSVSKPSLFKAGAEKLRFVYGLTTEMSKTSETIDYDKKIYDVSYKCTVKTKDGQILAECEGNVNSFEPKYAYSWISEDQLPEGVDKSTLKKQGSVIQEFQFALQKMETTGKYGKPQAYWDKWVEAKKAGKCVQITKKTSTGKEMTAYEISSFNYRIANPDVLGLKNTMMKMAQKRAFVGAILMATGASEFYTQDVEDMEFQNLSAIDEMENLKHQPAEEGVIVDEKKDKVKDLEKGI